MSDFNMQMSVWGYVDLGLADHSAEVAELGYAFWEVAWDSKPCPRTGRGMLNGKPAPDWFYTPYLGEHIRRGHEVLSGQ